VSSRESLSPEEARRAIMTAQGFGAQRGATDADANADGQATPRQVLATVRRLNLLQIDSVNVLTRAHYLPVFSRLGDYRRSDLDHAGNRSPRRLFEYWGHEAALLPVELQPLFRWRMIQDHAWGNISASANADPQLTAKVLEAVAVYGPASASELEKLLAPAPRTPKTHWGWNWSASKRALAHLFWTGQVVSTGRDRSFQRHYALPEKALPAAVLATPTPDRATAIRQLVARAGLALGVATARDLADYFRLTKPDTVAAIETLTESGELIATTVPGWPPAWRHRKTRIPRALPATDPALIVPFDPLIWHRERVQRVFGMRYRIEIYVPAGKRQFGYYVLPLLADGQLIARVDLKADRLGSRLLVQSAHAEQGQQSGVVLDSLIPALRQLSSWLSLDDVVATGAGDLGAKLQAGLRGKRSTFV